MFATLPICEVMYMECFFAIMKTIVYIEPWHAIFSENSKLVEITILSVQQIGCSRCI